MTAQAIATPLAKELMATDTNEISRTRLWTGRALTTLSGLFLVMDGGMKLIKPPFVVQGTVQLGYPESAIVGTGVVLLICTVLYLIPRTAVLGAMLLTGYLGGAIAINVRAGQPAFNIVFVVIFACVAWGGLWLRITRLEQLLSLKREH
jgi:hypothetical protein